MKLLPMMMLERRNHFFSVILVLLEIDVSIMAMVAHCCNNIFKDLRGKFTT
jgi:hypothetical protein